jgi:hypothetical protein
MHRPRRLAVRDPERRLAVSAKADAVRHRHHDLHAEGGKSLLVEGAAGVEVVDADDEMVDHGVPLFPPGHPRVFELLVDLHRQFRPRVASGHR